MENLNEEIIIEKTAEFIAKLGTQFEERLKEKNQGDPRYAFLFPLDSKYKYYKQRVEYFRNIRQNEDNAKRHMQEHIDRQRKEFDQFDQSDRLQFTPDPPYQQIPPEPKNEKRKKTRWSSSKWAMADDEQLGQIHPSNFQYQFQQVSHSPSQAHLLESGGSFPFGIIQGNYGNTQGAINIFQNPLIPATIPQPPSDYIPESNTKQIMREKDITVGIMASMLKQNRKDRQYGRNGESEIFRPLNPQYALQFNKNDLPTREVLDKVEEFIVFLNQVSNSDSKDIDSSHTDKKSEILDKANDISSNEKDNDNEKENEKERKIKKTEKSNYEREPYSLKYSPEIKPKQNPFNQEMGITDDGQAIADYHTGSEERRGLGANRDDIFDNFRKQRSFQYHVSVEERAKGIEAQQLCFICQRPGHLAKDCKYGLT